MSKDDRELIEALASSLDYFIRSLGRRRKDGTHRFGGIVPNDIAQNAMAANNAAATRLEALQAQPVGEAYERAAQIAETFRPRGENAKHFIEQLVCDIAAAIRREASDV